MPKIDGTETFFQFDAFNNAKMLTPSEVKTDKNLYEGWQHLNAPPHLLKLIFN